MSFKKRFAMSTVKKSRVATKRRLYILGDQAEKELINKGVLNKVVFKWKAPDRIAIDKDNFKFASLGGVLFLVGLYFLWIGKPLFAVAVAAVFFLYYVLYTTPAREVEHSIELLGIRSFGVLYPWDNLINFWFAEKDGNLVLYVSTTLAFPTRLMMVVPSREEAQKILLSLVKYLPYRRLIKKQSWWDKTVYGRYLPPEEIVDEDTVAELVDEYNKIKAKVRKRRKSP